MDTIVIAMQAVQIHSYNNIFCVPDYVEGVQGISFSIIYNQQTDSSYPSSLSIGTKLADVAINPMFEFRYKIQSCRKGYPP